MEESISNLLRHKNFGRTVATNPLFRTMFHQNAAGSLASNILSRFEFDRTGNLIDKLGTVHERQSGESYTDYLHRVSLQVKTGFTGRKKYGPMPDMSFSGGQTNLVIRELARRHGLTAQITTFNPKLDMPFAQAKDAIESIIEYDHEGKMLGLLRPDADSMSYLELFENGKAINIDRIQQVLGAEFTGHPNIFKRYNMFLNDRQIERIADPSEKVKVLVFDPIEVFKSDPAARRAARLAVKTGDVTTIEEAYEKMSDGFSIVTEHEIRRQMDFMIQQRNELLSELNTAGLDRDSAEYLTKRRNISLIEEQIDKLDRGLLAHAGEGLRRDRFLGGFMPRVLGATNAETGEIFNYMKGDSQFFSQDRILRFLKNHPKYQHMSNDELSALISDVSFIVSKADEKTELLADGTAAVVRMFHQPAAKEAYSNSLAMSTMGQLLNPIMPGGESYLMQGLKAQISDEVSAITRGEITPGLVRLIDEMEREEIPLDISEAERAARLRSKAYAKRLQIFIRGGGDFRTNPYMAQQALEAIRKHHFRTQTEPDGSPAKIMFRGAEEDFYKLRAPQRMATATHMTPSLMAATDILPGAMSYDSDSGRFLIHGATTIASRHAHGGSDFDDMLVDGLRYDPNTRRALYFGIRDPNSLGEYMYYDADIRTDPNVPLAIKQYASERDQLLMKIAHSQNTANVSKDIRRVDAINTILHRYFTGGRITTKSGQIISQSDIPLIDLAQQYADDAHRVTFAPVGTRVTASSRRSYMRANARRGFVTSAELGGKDRFIANLVANSSPTARSSIFRFVGKHTGEYADYMDMGLFQRHEGIEKAIQDIANIGTDQRFDTEAVLKRLDAELMNRGMLGRFVNPMAVIEEMLAKYANVDNYSGVPMAQAQQFQERFMQEFSRAGIYRIDREAVIDALTKSGGGDLINMIPEMLAENDEKIGRLIATMQQAAKDMNVDIGFGIDPLLYESRGTSMTGGLLRGYGGQDVNKLLLHIDDPMAYMSNIFGQTVDLKRKLVEETIPTSTANISQNLLNQLEAMNFKPTALEITRAQDFLNYYADNLNQIKEARKNQDLMLQKLMEGLDADDVDEVLAPYTDDAAQIRSLFQLQEWGLLDPQNLNDLDRQLLAIAQTAAQGLADTGSGLSAMNVFDALMRGSMVEGAPSITDLYQGALVRQAGTTDQILDELLMMGVEDDGRFEDLFKQFFRYYGDSDTGHYYSVNHALNPYLDRPSLFHALGTQADYLMREAYDRAAKADEKKARRLQRRASRLREMRDHADQQAFELSRTSHIPETSLDAGLGRFFARENADETADAVSSGRIISDTFNTMKRFDRQAVKDLMNISAFRKGIVGVSIFAGIGLLYGATRDRTPEDMQGPPLLPGGSAYEQFSEVPPDLTSIYSSARGGNFGPGVLYRINLNGSFDSNQVRDRIQSITGSPVDTRIYSSRQTGSRTMNSRDLMDELTR